MRPPTTPPRRGRSLAAAVAAALLLSLAPTLLAAPAAADPADGCPWMDTSLPADTRAQLLLDASTLEQTMRWLVEQPAAQPDRTEWPDGVTYPEQVPCTPEIAFVDGAHGIRGPEGVTAFAAPIAEASTWNPELTAAKYEAMAAEAWGKQRSVVLAPGLSSARTPLLTRTSEYYGEDPVLAGALGGTAIEALQGADVPILATPKHYVVNEQRYDEHRSSMNVEERPLHQLYNLPFEIAYDEGGAAATMCSYNLVHNAHACENPDVLQDLLREDTGYEGFVMSDFGSVHSTAESLHAGMDMELNRPVYYAPEELHAALEAGEITEEQITTAAFRVVRGFIETGLFDTPLPEEETPDVSTPEHRDIAQQIAEQGSVLLHNDDEALPLTGDAERIAVIGPTASNEPTDGVSAQTVCSAHFGSYVDCPDPVAPLDAITDRAAEDGATVVFDDGSDPEAAAQTAAEADVAIVFGYKSSEYQEDFTDLSLNGNGDALIDAVAGANDHTVVVLAAGTAVTMPWLQDVGAVLQTWYPGQQQGAAIANLLWGDVVPSGRTVLSFPESVDDLPTAAPERYPGIFEDGSTERPDEEAIRQVDMSEGMGVGYRWYEGQGVEPLFAFGHGLSYTEFSYSRLRVTPRSVDGERDIRVRFRLTNTGEHAAREVSQVYLELPAEADEPSHRLVGWADVELEPGETERVEVALSAEELDSRHLLQYWDTGTDAWTTPQGTYTVRVGGSSADLPLERTLRVR